MLLAEDNLLHAASTCAPQDGNQTLPAALVSHPVLAAGCREESSGAAEPGAHRDGSPAPAQVPLVREVQLVCDQRELPGHQWEGCSAERACGEALHEVRHMLPVFQARCLPPRDCSALWDRLSLFKVCFPHCCRKGDLYVHADLHGAASTIIKNSDVSRPVPPLSIQQACVLALPTCCNR